MAVRSMSGLGVSGTGGDPEERIILGALKTEMSSPADGLEEEPAGGRSNGIADFAEAKVKSSCGPIVAIGCANRGSPGFPSGGPDIRGGIRARGLEYGVPTSHARGGRRGGEHGRSVCLGATGKLS